MTDEKILGDNLSLLDSKSPLIVTTSERLPECNKIEGPVHIVGKVQARGTAGGEDFVTITGIHSGHYYLLRVNDITAVEKTRRFARARIGFALGKAAMSRSILRQVNFLAAIEQDR